MEFKDKPKKPDSYYLQLGDRYYHGLLKSFRVSMQEVQQKFADKLYEQFNTEKKQTSQQ